MANKQSRRSISINRQIHDNAKEQAKKKGISLSSMTEQALLVHMAKDAHPELAAVFDQLINETRAAEAAKKTGVRA
jgi:hypothetical protein